MRFLSWLQRFLVGQARAYERPPRAPAIILAAFGTTHPEALGALENIEKRVVAAFPDYEVRLAFTSNHVRARWRERGLDPRYRANQPGVLDRYYQINNVLSELAYFQEHGARLILVQSLLMADGEEFRDLYGLIQSLKALDTGQRSLHPFPWLGLGPPALGLGEGDADTLDRAARALSSLGQLVANKEATVVLMAHGNERRDLTVFGALEQTLRGHYGAAIHIGLVEGEPGLEELKGAISQTTAPGGRLVLAPLMVVAGDHAKNDLAGDEDSWASELKRIGYNVEVNLAGLGSNNLWADLYVDSLRRVEREVSRDKAKEERLSAVA
ncbi:MAG: sirohydrochlorin cobaltochelatase [Deltaproteobacteria bacterium]|jgi:sirohydrochlorin cobaltochelatase|nr:sirohydrochlorin cobaltochelatase [Deltaproteobacteria bacterium]